MILPVYSWHDENGGLTCSAQQIRVVKGQDKLKLFRDKGTASGVALDRHFCTGCGSNVLLETTDPELRKKFIIVALGTLDEEMHWLPNKELFLEQKRHWVTGIHTKSKPKHKL
ncbi:hypothetical protein D9756_002855 [Leucocoprinus leucothites]|uniref:CENP-V/GFA domain-containing protein n=1 Tax=Leucocoprinus leucothites TaxID=201217 RepID=A0A8H5G7F9_9AGAR|nr:hypothetical protein D9756_002855 [Leucoagaricus leucothites]